MRYLFLALLTFLAGGLHATELSDLRKETKNDVDKLKEKYPEAVDYRKVSSTWETGENGWNELQKLVKDLEVLEGEDWWSTFKYTPVSATYTDEEMESFKSGVAATEKLAGQVKDLLKYDCFLPPHKEKLESDPSYMEIMNFFSFLSSRVSALVALKNPGKGLKTAEVSSVLARRVNLGGTIFGKMVTSGIRASAIGTFASLDPSIDGSSESVTRILKTEPLLVRPYDIWIGELSYALVGTDELLSMDDDALASLAKRRNEFNKKMGVGDTKCTSVSLLKETRTHLNSVARVIEATPKSMTNTADIKSAEVLVKSVEATAKNHETAMTPKMSSIAEKLINSDAIEQAWKIVLRIRQLDGKEASIDETKKQATKVLENFSGLTLKWEGATASFWFSADHPVHRISDTANKHAIVEFKFSGK
ncbi:MAG: hypothetical protein ACYTDT_05265 [Planctomycetota bacterium]